MKKTPRIRTLVVTLCVLYFLLVPALLSAGENKAKEVLVLHSYHRGLPWDDSIDQGIESVFKESGLNIKSQFEYMDSKRISDVQYLSQLFKIYKHKFRQRKFDVIVSIDNNALNFLLEHDEALFPRTPVVFCGVNNFQGTLLMGRTRYTGVVENIAVEETIDTALKLHPKAGEIIIYGTDTPTYLANREIVKSVIPSYKGAVKITFVEGLNIMEIQDHARKLSDRAVVMLIASARDEKGDRILFGPFGEMVAAVSPVPQYSLWDFTLGHGVLGGKLISGAAQGASAAMMALRILKGEKVADIPIQRESPNRFMFDYTQLKRFELSPADLPPESIVINKPRSFYSRYRNLVWGVIITIASLLLLIVALGFNIVRRRRAEVSLKTSEKRFRELFDSVTDLIYTQDLEGRFLSANKTMTDLFGYDPEEFIGKPASDFMKPELKRHFQSQYLAGLRERGYDEGISVYFPKDGRKIYLEYRSTLVQSDVGGTYISGIGRNVTERVTAERNLRVREERVRTVLQASPNPMVVYDTEGIVQFLNKAFTDIFGWSQDDLMGKRAPFVPNEQRAETLKRIQQLYDSGTRTVWETKRKTRDGRILDVLISAALIRDAAGSATEMVVSLTDLTEKKKMEAALLQAQKMEAIGTLAGGVAHDFNNLLMGIQGNISLMLLEMAFDHLHYEKLKNVEKYVQQGADLSRQLLGFARGGKCEVKPTYLNELIEKESRMFARTRKEIRMVETYEPNLWSVAVDRGQMSQVLLNLYINASQAMPGGGEIRIRTANVFLGEDDARPFQMAPGEYVRISVSDTGAGMDEATRKRIFEPFFTTKEMGRGTGLGLASVYGIIKNHDGHIRVDSAKEHGATFDIFLPAMECDAVPTQAHGRETAEILRGTETVLFVDDEEMILEIGTEFLENMGYDALSARSGREAIDIYRKNRVKIDMVIVDMVMPDMGGGAIFDELKKINRNVKVLLSSGYSIDGQASDIMKRGCSGFIQKPFKMKQLSQKLREILESEETQHVR